MSRIPSRIGAALSRIADEFTVGANTRTGVFWPCPAEEQGAWLTTTELGAAGRPVWLAVVPAGDVTAVADTVVWNGLTLTVKRAIPLRWRGETVARQLVLTA